MRAEISPTTHDRIQETERDGKYEASHGGVKMQISIAELNGKLTVTLAACFNRRWQSHTCPTIFAAVERFNELALPSRSPCVSPLRAVGHRRPR
jgi:hypothetical protein